MKLIDKRLDAFIGLLKRIKQSLYNETNLQRVFIAYFYLVVANTTTLVIDYPSINLVLKLARYTIYFYILLYITICAVEYIYTRDHVDNDQLQSISLLVVYFGALLVNFFFTDNRTLFLTSLVMLGFCNINLNKILKLYFINQIITVYVVVTLHSVGVLSNYISLRGEIVRQSLGFDYPTNLPQLILFSLIYRLTDKKFRVIWLELVFYQIIIVLVFQLTNSKTEFILSEVIIALPILLKFSRKYKIENLINLVMSLFVRCYYLLPIMSIVLMIIYGIGRENDSYLTGPLMRLNDILSNRLEQSWMNFGKEGITFFGSKTPLLGYGAASSQINNEYYQSNFIDNDYLNLLFTKGFLFFVVFNMIIYRVINILFEEKQYSYLLPLLVILIFALINPRLFTFEYSCLGIFIFNILLSSISGKKRLNAIDCYREQLIK